MQLQVVNQSRAEVVLEPLGLPLVANAIPGFQIGDTTSGQPGKPHVPTHEGGSKAADSKSGQENAQQEDGGSGGGSGGNSGGGGYAGGSGATDGYGDRGNSYLCARYKRMLGLQRAKGKETAAFIVTELLFSFRKALTF